MLRVNNQHPGTQKNRGPDKGTYIEVSNMPWLGSYPVAEKYCFRKYHIGEPRRYLRSAELHKLV